MNDVRAIAGQLMSYRTLADGTLRITVDLRETETQHFHDLFPAVHCEVAVAPMRPVQMVTSQTTIDYGPLAKILRASNFCKEPDVWRATGSDETFLAWIRTQKCCARSGKPCDGPVQAAHVWRLKDDFGKGIKGPYAAVPLCAFHHRLHHQETEDAIGGRQYMEDQRMKFVVAWVWATIKDDLLVASMRDAEPAKVLAWCQKRSIEQFLPIEYVEAA